MTAGLALACGEVPWEREVLEAIAQSAEPAAARRYVDMGALAQDAGSGALGAVVLMSPAVRGFDAKPVHAVVASGAHVVVLLDTIRPPWLADSGLDCRELVSVHFPSLVDELVRYADAGDQATDAAGAQGVITVFAGVGGGVGTTTLAWIHAQRHAESLVIDAHETHPSLGFLCGADASSSTLLQASSALLSDQDAQLRAHAIEGRFLTLPLGGSGELGERDASMLADACTEQASHTIVDAGALGDSTLGEALLGRARRLVLVTTGTPMGMVRLPGAVERSRREGLDITVVVNRFRESLASSGRAKSAVRGLAERSCGLVPVFIDDEPALFDHAWLSGDWRQVAKGVPGFSA